MKIAALEALVLNVSDKTNGFFIRVSAENGLTGVGEATLTGWEAAQLAVAAAMRSSLVRPSARTSTFSWTVIGTSTNRAPCS